MEHNETGCQAREAPILCVNNCGFLGSATTMNMCSKCHKDHVLKQEQANLASSSIDSIVNRSSPVVSGDVDFAIGPVAAEPKELPVQPSDASVEDDQVSETKAKQRPNRCNACEKRVGLSGFNCRCGSLYCVVHRYSDKHNCPFDYRTSGREAIAKANPFVKAEKLDKI